jgi:diacylglycerol kinase (CTP)
MSLSFRNELYRKSIHLCALSIPLGYYILGRVTSVYIILAALLVSLYIDLSRIYHLPAGKQLNSLIAPIIRDHEKKGPTGATYILTAGLAADLFLKTPVAAAVMGFVILGDLTAALVGKSCGSIRLPGTGKTLEGACGNLAVCLLVAWITPGLPVTTGIIGALTAVVVEAYSGRIDDNIAVVVAAGLVMSMI